MANNLSYLHEIMYHLDEIDNLINIPTMKNQLFDELDSVVKKYLEKVYKIISEEEKKKLEEYIKNLSQSSVDAKTKEICQCGHEKKEHLLERDCAHQNDIYGNILLCQCQQYTPIPALLPNDTSSDPLCPVCKQYLIEDDGIWFCSNEKCEKYK